MPYTLKHPTLEISTDWDPALGTFFLQVIDPNNQEEEGELAWLGTEHQEFTDAAEFLVKVEDTLTELGIHTQVEVPGNLTELLEENQRKRGDTFAQRPAAIQQLVLRATDAG